MKKADDAVKMASKVESVSNFIFECLNFYPVYRPSKKLNHFKPSMILLQFILVPKSFQLLKLRKLRFTKKLFNNLMSCRLTMLIRSPASGVKFSKTQE